ncbi:haloacid dehalogenase-like hydrolase [Salicibibacter halophilus]|uniref:Haloacid dehalogenase-like hydrolase n=1 Tax=Salicibibacter halophilus TaxID=2502791 RepID=A0A514LEV2_9BACI|nr:haloacid dehalogenase-like hydrolase [Salicibibacter halophilus]QDI90388.1 haloacid dehalogenase-like hydrolase [Salicibibacter halophilus]
MKRLLDCTASDFAEMNGMQLRQAIEASEGRVMLSEVVCASTPLYPGLTNAEYAAAFGADMILLNAFNVDQPNIQGLSADNPKHVITELKTLIGRPVGINLEPVDADADRTETLDTLPKGRTAIRESLEKAKELSVDFVCFTGNPKTGVTNTAILKSIREAKDIFRDDILIFAGKMHGAGVKNKSGDGIVSENVVAEFAQAGADIILLPGVGSVPGTTLAKTETLVQTVHERGALALTAIGTSQEGAARETIQQIALENKMAGADVHHIGDAGEHGIAVPENIMDYSTAIRGKRHTYVRMAASINR